MYVFLAKLEEKGDMRKNSRLMEFCTVVNRLLKHDNAARGRNLRLRTFSVLPLTEEAGIIEWVPHTSGLRQLVYEELTLLGCGRYDSTELKRIQEIQRTERDRNKAKKALVEMFYQVC